MKRTAYRNARLLDPATGLDTIGGLLAENGVIADLGPAVANGTIPEGADSVDCAGAILAPGLVDIRVQLREPGAEHQEDFDSASRAAAAGGVTTMVALPNTDPVVDDVAGIEFVARRAREVKTVKVFTHAAITRDLAGREMTEFGLLREAGAVAFSDGPTGVSTASVVARALSYARTFDALLMQHPEEPSLVDDGVMNAGELSTRLGLPGIPREAEIIMLDRDLTLVEMTGGRYHAAAISTAAAVDRIRIAKERGLDVTCDATPPSFALNELSIADYRTFAKLVPPLRSEDDRQAIIEALKDGTIDLIASDHAPQDQDSKRLPFAQAAPGGIGLETLLPLTLELAHNGHLSLVEALRKVTITPAGRMGLPVGRLSPGAPADLILFDPDRPWRIDADRLRSKSKNSPFDGRLVQGQVLRTVVDGRTIYAAAET